MIGLIYIMNFLEKSCNKLVNFLFPFVERSYPFVPLVLILAVFFIPVTYWQIRIVSILLWFVTNEIHFAGVMERDYLPIQPGSSPIYHIYRFISGVFLLFMPILLVIMLIPGMLLWLRYGFCGAFIIAVLIRDIGDRIYRPKKPEE